MSKHLSPEDLEICRNLGITPEDYQRQGATPAPTTVHRADPTTRADAAHGLSPEELEICRNLEITPEDYMKGQPTRPTPHRTGMVELGLTAQQRAALERPTIPRRPVLVTTTGRYGDLDPDPDHRR